MKNIIWILILIILQFKTSALEIKLTQFNIRPGSNVNNTEGFLKLSNYLKGKKDITISFKRGVYLVGLQKNTNSTFENINNIFSIIDCSNITINGNGAIIKYANNLRYGSFDPVTQKPLNTKGPYFEGKNAVYPGNCIAITNSSQITVANLQLDGNLPNAIIGGMYGDTGIQLWYRGFYIVNSQKIFLRNLNIHHFGLDGIEISTNKSLAYTTKYNYTLKNINSHYNGRQGISWTGGNGLFIENSEFSHTGQSKIFSNPGAGCDLEPEAGNCKDGYFYKCKFENNKGPGFVSDYHGKIPENIVFRRCTFGGSTAPALWPHNGNITIDSSIIYGQILSPAGVSNSARLLIKNSQISDFNPLTKEKSLKSNILIDAGGYQKFYEFNSCVFNLNFTKLCYLESASTNPSEMPLFINNITNFNYYTFAENDFIALFRGCILENNKFNMNIKNIPAKGLYILTGHGTKIKKQNNIIGNNANIGWNSPGGPKILSEQ